MRYLLLSLLFVCIASTLPAQVVKIKDAGPDDKRINFTILGDGYTAAEQADYAQDAQNIITGFFNEPPYSNYSNFFNVHRITVESPESGADHPSGDREPDHPELYVNTALDASFHWGGSVHRLLYAHTGLIGAVVAANYPASDQELVVINTPFYGGGGGSVAVFSTASSAIDLAIHETGHSFAGLGDEYDIGTYERPNVTVTANGGGNTRWNDWIGINGIGEYTRNSTTLKPSDGECMMEFLSRPFCSVCQEATIEAIYQLINPLETTTPATAEVMAEGEPLDFSITTVRPIPNTLTVEWELDGQPLTSGVEAITLQPSQLPNEEHSLLVRVTDDTELSMKNANYVFTYTWTIQNQSLPVDWVAFTARPDGKLHRLDWTIANPENSSHFLVERAGGDGVWAELGRLPFAEATADYRFYDDWPLAGDNHYRIRAVDLDGTLSDSPLRTVRMVRKHYFKVYPTLTAGPLRAEVFRERAEAVTISVVDAGGRVVRQLQLPAGEGWLRQGLDLTGLGAGSYVLHLVSGQAVHTERVVVR